MPDLSATPTGDLLRELEGRLAPVVAMEGPHQLDGDGDTAGQVVNECGPAPADAGEPELRPAVRILVDRARTLAFLGENHDEEAASYRQMAERYAERAREAHAERIDCENALANLGPEGARGLVELSR